MNKAVTTAAILVGGKGTRLRSVIADRPKPLAPVAGKPFLHLILDNLAAEGIQRVVLLTGYQHEKIVEACGDGRQFNLEIVYSQEMQPLGTGGALLHAKPYLEGHDFILLNGDTYLECGLQDFLNYPLGTDWLGLIGAMQPLETERFGTLQISDSYRIEAFREKTAVLADQEEQAWVNAGIYKFSSALFSLIPANQFCSLENEIFPELVHQDRGLRAFPLTGAFYDIGVPESYAGFNLKFK